MKYLLIGLIALATLRCSQSSTKERKMEQIKIVEMVLWKSKTGVSTEAAQKAVTQLNDFVKLQPGFIARKTALAEDGQFLDLVYWTDLASAKKASEKAMQNEDLIPIFSTMDEQQMTFQHFEVFNQLD